MKIGIMGGTFDPIHNGHLMLGQAAYETFHLDQIWFMPNGHPPHKDRTTIESDVDDRIEMVRLAIGGKEEFRLELYEACREEVSYSYSTMEFFNQIYPEDEFYFIIGADSLFQLETWYHPERVMELASLLVSGREYDGAGRTLEQQAAYLRDMYGARIQILHNPEMNVASARIRELAARGESIEELVPRAVAAYIRERRLYQEYR